LDPIQTIQSGRWERRIRIGFWTIGVLAAGLLAYTTRHYLNGDGINYIEMGEALRQGRWAGLVNLTESPGYAFLLGLAQMILNTDRVNELPMLKIANLVLFLFTMACCDLLMSRLKRQPELLRRARESFLPFPVIMALAYGMFLIASLSWIRVRLVAPDMVVFSLVMISMTIILWIRESPAGHFKSLLLGAVMGLGYLTKAFFFPFAPVFFVLAGLSAGSVRKALSSVVVAALTMLLIGAPLIVALSKRVGHFSYGEAGNFNYIQFVASKGKPIHPPEELNRKPQVLYFRNGSACTYPFGFDIAAWHLGIRPVFDPVALLKLIPGNVRSMFEESPWLFLLIFLWVVVQWRIGALRLGRVFPPSPVLLMGVPAVLGIGLYSLMYIEMRYVAPFVFLGFLALILSPKYNLEDAKTFKVAVYGSVVMVVAMLAFLAGSVVDDTVRGLLSTEKKLSFQDRLLAQVRVKDFLAQVGVGKGDYVGIVGRPPIYWARMAETRVLAVLPHRSEFLSIDPSERKAARASLRAANIKALVAADPGFRRLTQEGWMPAPGTRDYFVLPLRNSHVP